MTGRYCATADACSSHRLLFFFTWYDGEMMTTFPVVPSLLPDYGFSGGMNIALLSNVLLPPRASQGKKTNNRGDNVIKK
jgi:hypothetical protein